MLSIPNSHMNDIPKPRLVQMPVQASTVPLADRADCAEFIERAVDRFGWLEFVRLVRLFAIEHGKELP